MKYEAGDTKQPASRLWFDSCGYVAFIAEITDASKYYINVSVYSVTSWDIDRNPVDKELYYKAYIKWDGCSHVWFGEEDDNEKPSGYLHLCGVQCWKDHVAVMKWLYTIAETEIPQFDPAERWSREERLEVGSERN